MTALTKRGFSKQELADAGLTNRFGGDLYRGRMVVALMDATGRVVGFTGRIIHDEANAPKYLNTPQTLLFDKSRHIFGLSQAKEAIRKSDEVVIVEGNLDVVSSHQAGVRQVVATAGTAITEQHLKALSRLASRIKLAFDGDKAGLNATERAIKLSQTIGVELEVVSLPEGSKDPDELIKLHGVKQWELAITNAVPAVAWVIQQYSQRENVRTAEGKRRFSTASLNLIRSLHDPVEQEHYLQMVAEKTGASIEALTAKMSGITTNKTVLRHPKVKKTAPQKPSDETLDMLLGLAVQEPGVRRWLASVPEEITDNVNTRELLKYLTQNPNAALDPMPETLKNIEEYVKIVQLKFDTRYADWDKDDLPGEMARLVKHVISKHRENKIQQLMSNLRDAEIANDESLAQDLRHQLNALIKEKA